MSPPYSGLKSKSKQETGMKEEASKSAFLAVCFMSVSFFDLVFSPEVEDFPCFVLPSYFLLELLVKPKDGGDAVLRRVS
jgi:hypothetical protein